MKRNTVFALIALVLALALSLCACGKKAVDDSPMALTDWTLSPQTWSSPNGATVNLTAQVNHKDEAVSASFVVRMGDGDVVNAPCTWDGDKLTAAAELNAADGYSYFVVLTAADGSLEEVPLSTTEKPVSTSLVNLASALNSYCNIIVEDSNITGSTLTLTAGSLEIQAPQITNDGAAITCQETALVLMLDGEEVTRATVTPEASEVPGGFEAGLAGTTFQLPSMAEDGQLILQLKVTLSNGQILTCEGATWTYMDGQVFSAVG